jgi:hypothetical protein
LLSNNRRRIARSIKARALLDAHTTCFAKANLVRRLQQRKRKRLFGYEVSKRTLRITVIVQEHVFTY